MTSVNTLEDRFVLLKSRAVFQITGADRVRYLNGQVTNDVSKVLTDESVAACVCSLKGRVEFLVWIRSDGDSLWVDGQLDQRDELFARLDRYLIADDCEIHDRTEMGELCHHFLQEGPGTWAQRCITRGKDLWIATGEPNPFPSSHGIPEEKFEDFELQKGIPRYPEEITGAEFPAELGIDPWTVDFHKGCYLGQEVISRIESVGRVRRRLCLVVAKSGFDQNSLLRNEDGTKFEPTRQSKEISKEINLGFAWARTELDLSQPVLVE